MDKMTIKFRSNILKLNDENLAKEKIQKDFTNFRNKIFFQR